MTTGSLYKNIIVFSIPLMFSNILQVLFNMSDIAVVGRFAGSDALGAVGSCTILVSLFTGLLIGMGGGINAITARFAGARDVEKLQKAVHTAFLISLVYGIVITAGGLLTAKTILTSLNTKPEFLDSSVLYMTVYLLGTPALSLYNFGSGVLSAMGDSRRPLLYLLISGIINVALNLFFVIACHMSVLGVALASAASQYISAGLVIFRLSRCGDIYALHLSKMKLDRRTAKNILMLGIPSALQNAIFAMANLFIQTAVNSFDTIMVAGNSAAANADTLVYSIMEAFYIACTSFMGQNYGAGNKQRLIKSYKICMLYAFSVAAVIGILLLIFDRQFLSMFSKDNAVIEAGLKRLTIMACSYCVSSFMDTTIAASRGIGKTIVPTIIVITGSCVLRIIWIYTIFVHFHTIPSLYLLYIFSWSVTAICEMIYFFKTYNKQIVHFSDTAV